MYNIQCIVSAAGCKVAVFVQKPKPLERCNRFLFNRCNTSLQDLLRDIIDWLMDNESRKTRCHKMLHRERYI